MSWPTTSNATLKIELVTFTSLSVTKSATNQTQNNSTVDDEDDNIHEVVSSDPDYCEIDSYN